MAYSNGGRDRSSVVAFAAFWVVIGIGIFLGYHVVNAIGLGSRPDSSAASRPDTAAHASPTPTDGPPPLTTAAIFSPTAPNLANVDRSRIRTLIATGDVIPARSVNYRMVVTHNNDFLYPFRPTASYLRTGDITLINLESPLVSGCPVTDAGMSFCGDPRVVQGLKFAGVDTACTANNHIGNYGDQGIQETWTHLRQAGIGFCGLGRVDHKTIRGLTFAFLAYNAVGQRFDYAGARREIRQAKKHAGVVVVSVHWGKEYEHFPTTAPGIADDNPRNIGRWIIDSGADLVIGNHPHWVQGVEMYHGRLITYAHGNFVFDQMFSDETRQGVVGTYTFYDKRLVAVRYRPVFIYDYSQPRWATTAQAAAILAAMRSSTWQLAHRR